MNRLSVVLQSDFLETLDSYFQRIQQGTHGWWGVAAELLLVGSVVYAALRFLQGTRGERVLKSFWLMLFTSFLVVRLVAEKLELDRVIFLYPYFVGGIVLITLVAFQPEIRRGLIRMGETRWLRTLSKESERIMEPIVTAVGRLSQKKIGALIAIQREVGLDAIAEAGVKIDSKISAALLETIFWPGTALHDMGVIIQHSRIAAAACQFPIAESGELALSLGSRHRAALGMSHECDAIIIVVSEESGTISVAHSGNLQRGLTLDALRALLTAAAASDPAQAKPNAKEEKTNEARRSTDVAPESTREPATAMADSNPEV